MKTTTFISKYEIGQPIYHVTPESAKGIIVDVSYSTLTDKVLYLVSFGRFSGDQVECYEHELSENKTF